ncbi:TetR/AcrR family transcriptional regulator [Microlunatus antarcticus]|uniref:AcrR family transcriptional regulator n=1 Tax=Microlunatus antarcticus TaxID=53388 RepID=A0A7W5JVH1_9ACTN|nr:TetR/AcrR family transcriptional regulator [Microlunatus antarcticus]MBB3326965.1 AcrR family transcriptional regulator [Microlunatus antarcticus]
MSSLSTVVEVTGGERLDYVHEDTHKCLDVYKPYAGVVKTSGAEQRPRNAEGTRNAILAVARGLFARHGYRPTTVKAVADAAGVSPNLVTRYFGGKDGLFLAASQVDINEDDVYAGELSGFGRRLARSVVGRWTSQAGEDPLLVLHRASGELPEAAEGLARFLDEHSTGPVERYLRSCGLSPLAARHRAEAVDALVLGLSTRRRVLRSDVGDGKDIEIWLAESLQRIVSG